jgi:predicted transglutaminase-like protease
MSAAYGGLRGMNRQSPLKRQYGKNIKVLLDINRHLKIIDSNYVNLYKEQDK